MTNAHAPIYPCDVQVNREGQIFQNQIAADIFMASGLTIRQHFAGLAMSSMAVDGVMIESGLRVKDPETIGIMAVQYADALIKALNESK